MRNAIIAEKNITNIIGLFSFCNNRHRHDCTALKIYSCCVNVGTNIKHPDTLSYKTRHKDIIVINKSASVSS